MYKMIRAGYLNCCTVFILSSSSLLHLLAYGDGLISEDLITTPVSGGVRVISSGQNPVKQWSACFGTVFFITCPSLSVLVFESAHYGRNSTPLATRCGVPYSRHCDIDVHFLMNRACSGRRQCSLTVTSALFSDPCGYEEFLQVQYRCEPVSEVHNTCQSTVGSALFDHGYLTTPNYPDKYYLEAECRWSLFVQSTQKIRFTLYDFELDIRRAGACKDALEISSRGRVVFRECGVMGRQTLLVNDSVAEVRFFTGQSSLTQRGFFLHFQAVGPGCIDLRSSLGEDAQLSYFYHADILYANITCLDLRVFSDLISSSSSSKRSSSITQSSQNSLSNDQRKMQQSAHSGSWGSRSRKLVCQGTTWSSSIPRCVYSTAAEPKMDSKVLAENDESDSVQTKDSNPVSLNSNPSSSSSPLSSGYRTSATVLGVAGGGAAAILLVLLLIISSIYCFIKRRQNVVHQLDKWRVVVNNLNEVPTTSSPRYNHTPLHFTRLPSHIIPSSNPTSGEEQTYKSHPSGEEPSYKTLPWTVSKQLDEIRRKTGKRRNRKNEKVDGVITTRNLRNTVILEDSECTCHGELQQSTQDLHCTCDITDKADLVENSGPSFLFLSEPQMISTEICPHTPSDQLDWMNKANMAGCLTTPQWTGSGHQNANKSTIVPPARAIQNGGLDYGQLELRNIWQNGAEFSSTHYPDALRYSCSNCENEKDFQDLETDQGDISVSEYLLNTNTLSTVSDNSAISPRQSNKNTKQKITDNIKPNGFLSADREAKENLKETKQCDTESAKNSMNLLKLKNLFQTNTSEKKISKRKDKTSLAGNNQSNHISQNNDCNEMNYSNLLPHSLHNPLNLVIPSIFSGPSIIRPVPYTASPYRLAPGSPPCTCYRTPSPLRTSRPVSSATDVTNMSDSTVTLSAGPSPRFTGSTDNAC